MSRANTAKIVIPPTTISRKMGEETLLINLATNEVYTLNVTASRFWELLSVNTPLDEAATVLLDEFEVTKTQLQAEIDSILKQLLEQRFIQMD